MPSHDKQNITLNFLGESLWGLHASMLATATVVTVLLRAFGASEIMIGSLLAIEIGAVSTLQCFSPFVFHSRRHRRRQLMLFHAFVMIPFLFVAGVMLWFAPQLPSSVVRWSVLLSVGGFFAAIGVATSGWTDWLAHMFDVRIRGAAMGLAYSGAAFAGIGGALLAGWMIEVFPSPQVYCYLFLAAGTIAEISIVAFSFMKDPAEEREEDPTRLTVSDALTHVRESLEQSNFRAFLVGRVLAVMGFCVMPFFTVYFTSAAGGGLKDAQVVSYGAAAAIGAGLSNLALGRLGDIYGHRVGMLAGAAAQVGTLLVVLFGTGKFACLAAFAGAGICGGAGLVSHLNMLFETCPHDSRIAHIMTGNVIIGIVGIPAASLAGVLADLGGVRTLFIVSLGFSAIALLWSAFFVKEPREM